jgi:putative transcriptional regulator
LPAIARRAYSGTMDAPIFMSGQFLLAMPGIGDPRFEKAVIAMCVHDEEGALGIGLGRVVPRLGFHDLLKQLDIAPGEAPNVPIHLGGPVEPQRGFILHTPDWSGGESVYVGKRWVLSATIDILRAIADGKGPTRWVAALGYAGWGPGQLEQELARHGWFATVGDEKLLYDCDVDTRWAAAFQAAGVDSRLLTAEYGTA